ncbi:glycosyltransferase [Wenzhouxiangella sp. XN24]|uniref:glycosyltransferase n=1 Tax=Wenzhouxiangella sp. XN24 TaxID=2713569 RepID=UPI0013EB11A8|nr:glycosyltransferase [Wenzhouxiangella sp. XN24]NGX16864.1 glycosyltransferase family 4 protein [Wenzhouxiangella sp. XN24]
MKLLVVAPHPFFTPRGTPFSVYYRTLVMAEQGVNIDLLTYHPGQDVDIPGLRIVRIPRIAPLEPIPVGPSWRKLVLDVFMVLWTIGMLIRHRYPVVHAHEEAVFWCRYLKPIFRFRLIYDMHSSLPQQLENFRFTKSKLLIGTFNFLEDSCLKAADAVITICPDLRDYALAAGVPEERHFLIENSIFDDVRLKERPCDAVGGPSSAEPLAAAYFEAYPVVLYAGTFEAYQGIDVLIRAFAIVHRELPAARLVLAGGTEAQVEAMRALADSLGLGDACRFTGRVSKTEALQFNRSATVLVSPRVHGTNTPLKIYEQLASGKPLVATRIWSHTQVLDDSACFLVDPEPESMAAGLKAALDDPAEAVRRSRNARGLYERDYARPAYVKKIRRLLGLVGLRDIVEQAA